ncbi:anti-sigma factor family protein [Leekyejoonella antrihumi]|uniref:Zf-HC2 domain-containing protein n=1 Tax=Leekyejoonella antrihumi TaxID=1660198 RepID=A0A563E1C3_9MICO|nr:zf-HC2 domain-containing protein [Leekyejoonella antrihumi]TWP36195.1 zf-HC2 domain-containing protein [Leekyejoonella antrihumi]
MTHLSPDPFATYDAAYVMGALSDADQTAFEEHLGRCPDCRNAVQQLMPMRGLLQKVPGLPDNEAQQLPPMPQTVLPAMLRSVRRRHLRRRWLAGLAAAAAVVCLVAGTAAVVGHPSNGTAPGQSVALSTTAAAPLQATLRIETKSWGSELQMHCRYVGSATWSGATYELVVVPKAGGRTQTVARWTAHPGKEAVVTGSTNLTPTQISEVRVEGPGGNVLLHS